MQEWYLGWEKVSCLERSSVQRSGIECMYIHYTSESSCTCSLLDFAYELHMCMYVCLCMCVLH